MVRKNKMNMKIPRDFGRTDFVFINAIREIIGLDPIIHTETYEEPECKIQSQRDDYNE